MATGYPFNLVPLFCPSCEREYDSGTHCPADGAELLEPTISSPQGEPPDPPIGEVLDGRFRITGRVGAGGMGTVYQGVQLNIDRPVAIKLLHTQAAQDPQAVARFKREAQIVSKLRHPNTLKLIDFGQREDGTHYLVTELLEGRPLNAVITEGRLGERRTLHLMREICLSLEEAHAAGIVHRDLKPHNVFLEQVGDHEGSQSA